MHFDSSLMLAMFLSRISFLKPAERCMLMRRGYTLSKLQGMDTCALAHALGRTIRSTWWQPQVIIAQLSWHIHWLESRQGWACLLNDDDYPPLLAQIADPPVVLYGRGNKDALRAPCIGIVGTRKPNKLGVQAAHDLGALCAHEGYSVVSGLAYGIDIAAHKGVFAAQSTQISAKSKPKPSDTTSNIGSPIAVLGTGIDAIYPRPHIAYARDILAAQGAIISEMPPASHALVQKHSFIGRNRIISGMSDALIVVQCPEKSGALATAEFALDQGRTVWVHSAGLDEGFEGTQYLYACGAQCIDRYAF